MVWWLSVQRIDIGKNMSQPCCINHVDLLIGALTIVLSHFVVNMIVRLLVLCFLICFSKRPLTALPAFFTRSKLGDVNTFCMAKYDCSTLLISEFWSTVFLIFKCRRVVGQNYVVDWQQEDYAAVDIADCEQLCTLKIHLLQHVEHLLYFMVWQCRCGLLSL